jgi:predicted amidohydrolase YtcJ
VSDRPCLCQDFGEHEHWVNSRMLELMGVTRDTPDPVPGLEMFVRDEHGEATGQLRENVHLHFLDRMFDALGWRPPEDLSVERIRPFLRFLSEHGVTALLDAIVEDEQMLASVAELDRRGELNLFYDAALRFRDRTDLPGVLERLHELQAAYGNDHIRVRTVKLFLDGTNELGNSALLEPRCDHADPPGLGEIALSVDELLECCLLCNEQDVDVHIHLVGDRAFRVACDAVEATQARLSGSSTPWRIRVTLAHCELVDDADLHRPAQLGIAINWSTHWSGGYFGEGARPILGDERWRRMYRFNELADSGAVVAFSSDVVTAYESHRADPFFGMHVASTRVDPEFPLDPERFPASLRPETSARLPRDVLLRGYSLDGARQLGVEDSMGSLEVGKSANLVVLSADPLDPEVSLLDVDVDVVVFEGDVVVGGW